ncbi:hypothetical protein V8G54_017217 [Vigna mungo]|uniref:Uncharacterized protein n=1 Tax=Vigna mungo TaxID=3915 RepID=A0AAQ3NP38_VIGMU
MALPMELVAVESSDDLRLIEEVGVEAYLCGSSGWWNAMAAPEPLKKVSTQITEFWPLASACVGLEDVCMCVIVYWGVVLVGLKIKRKHSKKGQPSNQVNRNILAPAVRPSGIPMKPLRTRRALGLDIATSDQYRVLQQDSKKDFRNPRSIQEVRKRTPDVSCSGEGKSEKGLQKSLLNVGSSKKNSCHKPLEGSPKKGFRNPCSRKGFRNPHSTQEVRKITPAFSHSGEVRKRASEIPAQRTSKISAQCRKLKNKSYQSPTQQVQLCQVNNPSEWIVFSKRIKDQKRAEQERTIDPQTNSHIFPRSAQTSSHSVKKGEIGSKPAVVTGGSILLSFNTRDGKSAYPQSDSPDKILPTTRRFQELIKKIVVIIL